MRRIKWTKLVSQLRVDAIVSALHQYPYSEEYAQGFKVIESDDNLIEVEYVEKIKFFEIIRHPDGEEEEVFYDKFNTFRFFIILLSPTIYLIRIDNSPRTLKKFIRTLTHITNGSIDLINLNIEQVISILNSDKDIYRFYISNILIGNIRFTEDSFSRIEISSSKDAYVEFTKKFENISHLIYRMKSYIGMKNVLGVLEVTRAGNVNIEEKLYERLREKLPFIIAQAIN